MTWSLEVGGVGGLVLAAKNVGDLGGETTEHEPFGVDDMPGTFDLRNLGGDCGHYRLLAAHRRRSDGESEEQV